ncbi:MAG: transposase [Anaerovoracaceae bacterium]
MGLFDKVSKAASAVGEAAKEHQRRQGEMFERLESKSDDQLKKIIKSEGFLGSSDTEKNMARKILRERGY